MANSLETRAPLLDYRLIEFASQIPLEFLIRNGSSKYILRQVLKKYLPADILAGPKQGFSVPLSRWFRSDLLGFAREILLSDTARSRGIFRGDVVERVLESHARGRRDYSEWIYSLLNLELWHRTFMDAATRKV